MKMKEVRVRKSGKSRRSYKMRQAFRRIMAMVEEWLGDRSELKRGIKCDRATRTIRLAIGYNEGEGELNNIQKNEISSFFATLCKKCADLQLTVQSAQDSARVLVRKFFVPAEVPV